MSSKLYEMLGQLPGRVPYARRYRVEHRILGKVVEFRVLPRSASPEHRAQYHAELDELLALDHPCFPPVLERGRVRQREAYVVPYREHKTIPERIAEHSFYPPQAYAAVASLSGGLAALHDQGFAAGPIEPKMVCWDDRAGSAYFLQRRHRVPKFLASGEHVLPDDVRRFEEASSRADVFHWGFFAYFLLSRGKYPYQAAAQLTPLARWAPEVPRYLQVAVEATCSWRPEDRPADGAALQAVLLVGGGGGFAGSAPRQPESSPPASPAMDQSASRVFQAFLEEIDELHMSLGPGAARAMPAVPAPGAARDASSASDPDMDPDPEMDAYQSGSGLAAITLPTDAESPGDPDTTDATDATEIASDFAEDLVEIETGFNLARPTSTRSTAAAPGPALGAVVVVVFLLGSGAGWLGHALLAPAPPSPRPPRPTRPAPVAPASRGPTPTASAAPAPTASEPVRPGGASDSAQVEPLTPSEAAGFLQDKGVAQLTAMAAVPLDQAAETWKEIRSLMLQGRLPKEISDTKRLAAIRETLESRPEEGRRQLEAFLAELRQLLGRSPPAK